MINSPNARSIRLPKERRELYSEATTNVTDQLADVACATQITRSAQ